MELEFRPDFEQVCGEWDKFWAGTIGRPMILCEIPKGPYIGKPYPVRPDRPVGPQVDRVLAWARNSMFLGDTVPSVMMEFGPEHFATFLGADMHFHPGRDETGWVLPIVQDWDDFEIRFHRESGSWQKTVEFLRAFRAALDGRVMTSAPVLSGNLDALSAIRGPENLAMDLLDCPEKVERALKQVNAVYDQVVAEIRNECGWRQWGSVNWLGMHHRRAAVVVQCDFSVMISPESYRRFAVPNLRHEARHYGGVAYHLDGPEQIKHLPAIKEIDEITAIQFVPVARMTPAEIDDVYVQIAATGKGIVRGCDPETVHRMWRDLPTRQQVVQVWVKTPDDFKRLMDSF